MVNSYEANLIMITKWLSAAAAGVLLLSAGPLLAQNNAASATQESSFAQSYDIRREQTLVGTVLTYAAAAQSAPFGPRLILQTRAGVVDIHLGDARTLSASHFTIQAGDTLRVIGESVSLPNSTTQFLARILQKDTQAIAVRTSHGFPIPSTIPAGVKDGKKGGAM
jgi:hypothetical protein